MTLVVGSDIFYVKAHYNSLADAWFMYFDFDF